MTRTALTAALASTLAAALVPASAAAPDGQEACYGVALKGNDDCAAGKHSCAGMAKRSYDGADFKYVPAGTCATVKVHGHKGSLTPA